MRCFTALLLCCFLMGCCSSRQICWESSDEQIKIVPHYEYMDVFILPISSETRKAVIDVQRSFAVSSDKTRYNLLFRNPDKYVIPAPKNCIRKNVYLLDPNDKEKKKTLPWSKGEWELHLSFTGDVPRTPLDAKFKIWLHWYCPFIDGA